MSTITVPCASTSGSVRSREPSKQDFEQLIRQQIADEFFPKGAPDSSREAGKQLAYKAWLKLKKKTKEDPEAMPDWFENVDHDANSFSKMCSEMYQHGMDVTPEDWLLAARHAAGAIVHAMCKLAKELGQCRVDQATAAADFCRNIWLQPGSNYSQQKWYACPHYVRIPRKERAWFVVKYQKKMKYVCPNCRCWKDVIGDKTTADSGEKFSFLHAIQLGGPLFMVPCGAPCPGDQTTINALTVASAFLYNMFDTSLLNKGSSHEEFVETFVEWMDVDNEIVAQGLDMTEKGVIVQGTGVFTFRKDQIEGWINCFDLNQVLHLLMPAKTSRCW